MAQTARRYDVVQGWEQLPAGYVHRDVAGVAVFLASSATDWITGQVISVDGGITAGPHMPSFKHYGPKPKMD